MAIVAVAAVAVAVSRRDATVVAVAASAPEAATPDLPVGRTAPAVTSTDWLNTAPLTQQDLSGKVVLYDFWTFGCINCRNTLSHVRAWHARYAADGLVVIGIHTPEFDYEADPANVAEFVTDNDITYPVALDPEHRTWRAFDNHYWPAFFLHDRQGRERYTHVGEGAYDDTEDAIRELLGVDPSSPRAVVG